MNWRRLAVGFACPAVLSAVAQVAWCGDTVRILHSFSVNSPVHSILGNMVPEMEEAADYNARFEVYSAVELGAWDELMFGVFDGRFDFVLGPGSLFAAHRMNVGPLARSDLFVSFERWETFRGSQAEIEVASLFQEQDLELIDSTWLASEYFVARRPIRSMEDLKGMRVRVGWGNAEHAKLLEAFGATAVKIGAHESYLAMMQGVVDAFVEPIGWSDVSAIAALDAGGGTIVQDFLGGHVGWLVGRKDWRGEMDPFTAELVEKAMSDAMVGLGDQLEEREEGKLQVLAASGIEIAELDVEEKQVYLDTVRDSWGTSLDSKDRRIAELIGGW